ncbi:hypothetical protein mRhiFer1_008630 [Rhinolophus ferrumequinum]|uniref:Uncharacterized protein n=1 Tax=Rhinolophus ferrumequinum TaxID=59479 RepID=A0A7J7U134_RHIFE|nr:hypothetical protein mRhiFer1_008630 [Rhinolophus ferrumequinum]
MSHASSRNEPEHSVTVCEQPEGSLALARTHRWMWRGPSRQLSIRQLGDEAYAISVYSVVLCSLDLVNCVVLSLIPAVYPNAAEVKTHEISVALGTHTTGTMKALPNLHHFSRWLLTPLLGVWTLGSSFHLDSQIGS